MCRYGSDQYIRGPIGSNVSRSASGRWYITLVLKPAVMLDTKQAKEAQEPSTVEKCKNSSTRNGMLFLEKVSRIDIKVSVRPIRAGC